MSNISEFRLKVISEKSKVLQSLLKMIGEISENITYLQNSQKLDAINILDSLVNEISEMYDEVEKK